MANEHQIGKTIINNAVNWVESTLIESEEFKLVDLKERFKPGEEADIRVVIVDVEEQPIERPTEKEEGSYSGKKTPYDEIPNIDKWRKQRDSGRLQ